MPNSPNNHHVPAPPRSTRPARTYTAGCHERVTPRGNIVKRWVLMSQDGDILINEASERRLWWATTRFLNALLQFGVGA